MNWKEYAPYLTPSINIVKQNFKEEMSFILSNPWLNFYNRGFFQEVHDHGGNDLSCVFYLNDGQIFLNFTSGIEISFKRQNLGVKQWDSAQLYIQKSKQVILYFSHLIFVMVLHHITVM